MPRERHRGDPRDEPERRHGGWRDPDVAEEEEEEGWHWVENEDEPEREVHGRDEGPEPPSQEPTQPAI